MISWRCILVLVGLFISGCDGGRQVRTYADLQGISHLIVAEWSAQHISEAEINTAIHSVANEGLDAWGHPYIYLVKNQDWVVFSTGSDGKKDFDDAAYFELESEDIRGQTHRDIIFRNGKNVTYAGT